MSYGIPVDYFSCLHCGEDIDLKYCPNHYCAECAQDIMDDFIRAIHEIGDDETIDIIERLVTNSRNASLLDFARHRNSLDDFNRRLDRIREEYGEEAFDVIEFNDDAPFAEMNKFGYETYEKREADLIECFSDV